MKKTLMFLGVLFIAGCDRGTEEIRNNKDVKYISYKMGTSGVREWAPVGNPEYVCVSDGNGLSCIPKK